MRIDRERVTGLLRSFDFEALFIDELGWDRCSPKAFAVDVDSQAFILKPVAEKRGVGVFTCSSDFEGAIPPYAARIRIEREVRKVVYEHLVIFADPTHSTQVWQWVAKEPGKSTAYHEHTFTAYQPGQSLVEKLERIAFPLNEEEALTISGVTIRLRDAFDRDRVTKRFYDEFKQQHAAFLRAISGIDSDDDREWYASLMLNRLMFVYFIQKRGFLDADVNYLRHRLETSRAENGEHQFITFYRYFLLHLFHEGLGSQKRDSNLDQLVGDVPYLNGGLFEIHLLESTYPSINIPDGAFSALFAFFDSYQWHLDDRPLESDSEINPDVLGYIFEKYINQKELGAYYSREDITGFICGNSILPQLLAASIDRCEVPFNPDGLPWSLLRIPLKANTFSAASRTPVPLKPNTIGAKRRVCSCDVYVLFGFRSTRGRLTAFSCAMILPSVRS